ncbi:MAG: S-methyl-5'-thioadenosine phosphorylase [Actinomycetota bacterium]|nr:S-methyl-5'-thioadenosine phosphorylase [Actinomycetota bacterium]
MELPRVKIGIFGGSGFYSLLKKARSYAIHTPYGIPSDRYVVGEFNGIEVAFLPRHGRHHQYPPHSINYRANLWGMKELGVERIIAPAACGSLQGDIPLGTFVLCDQFIDRTFGRDFTFYDGPTAVHISCAEPYCPQMRRICQETAEQIGVPCRNGGTAVVVQGPRFSTKAESSWFHSMGWSVVNMTQYPEVVLSRELGMCYLNVSLVTDWDVWIAGQTGIKTVTAEEVGRVFKNNIANVKRLMEAFLPVIARAEPCDSGAILQEAVISPQVLEEEF